MPEGDGWSLPLTPAGTLPTGRAMLLTGMDRRAGCSDWKVCTFGYRRKGKLSFLLEAGLSVESWGKYDPLLLGVGRGGECHQEL